jgi:hypothetical protein
MDISDAANQHCHTCRYWVGRCCHALALRERDYLNPDAPDRCFYFAVDVKRLIGGTEPVRADQDG